MAAADAFSPWSDLCVPPDALRLAPTLLSGMSFRWHPSAAGNIYVGVLSDCIYELREDDATVHWRVCGPADSDRARAQLREHLSLDRGVTASAWAGGGQLPVQFFHAAAALPGVRVVSVLSRLESLVSFMGSANNNIKRNMQMVASLCANFEENRLGCDSEGAALFSFPSVAQLCSLSEERLWELGWGYRAPRLHKLSRQLEERGGEAWLDSLARLCDEELRAELVALCGVGRKAAARCSSAAPRSPVTCSNTVHRWRTACCSSRTGETAWRAAPARPPAHPPGREHEVPLPRPSTPPLHPPPLGRDSGARRHALPADGAPLPAAPRGPRQELRAGPLRADQRLLRRPLWTPRWVGLHDSIRGRARRLPAASPRPTSANLG